MQWKRMSQIVKIYSNEIGADLGDWRTFIINYLHDQGAKVDKSV
jgi:hypothetical protein